jgi:GT2 family glycosyltransferase
MEVDMLPTLHQLYAAHDGHLAQKWVAHVEEYELLFQPLRRDPVRLLERGENVAGALQLWARYFPNAVSISGLQSGVTMNCVGSAQAQFDIIIDSGARRAADSVRGFLTAFPLLAPGGLYIVEDVHCSYQQQYDGGLYAPYSVLSFFKRLADITGHEHWGIDKTPAQLLEGFAESHELVPVAELGVQLHAVTFMNGMCVLRKALSQRGQSRLLSAGGKTGHAPGRRPLFDAPLAGGSTAEQSSNPWSTLAIAPEQAWQDSARRLSEAEDQLRQAAQTLAVRDRDIAALYGSTSWRVSQPLRLVGNARLRLLAVGRRVRSVIAREGGIAATLGAAARVYRREGLTSLSRKARIVVEPAEPAQLDYTEWLLRYATLDDAARERMRAASGHFDSFPLISVVMPVYNTPLDYLEQAINSVRQQLYPHWELCIADDASTDGAVRVMLERHRAEEPRIKLVFRETNGHIAASSNSALAMASGEYIALFDHDDLLDEQALYWVADAINRHPNAGLIYSDEDKVDVANRRYDPYFKSDLNYELLLAQNMVCHLGVYRTALVRQLGGFQLGYEGAQDYDLALRVIEQLAPQQVVHVPRVLYHWRAIAGSTALGAGEKNYAARAGRKAVAAHLARMGLQAEVLAAPSAPGVNRVRFACPTPQPLVSILIPTRDRADLLGMCLDTLLERSTYSNYEVIIVDNGSVEEKTQQLFARLPKDRVRILRDDSAFNFSALNNHAARVARGQYLCLMNNDIEILTPDWLEEMVSFAARPDIGCVGARLWYPDGRLQHGGVVLGIGGIAGHAHKYLPRGQNGYFGRGLLHQSYSAVTAACLLLRRDVFEQVGGLDEALVIAFNDVDFCLRVREAGYRNVWTPYAEMIHHESASRGEEDSPEKIARFGREIAFVEARWGEQLRTDPAYNPNLTLVHEDYSLAWPPRVASL